MTAVSIIVPKTLGFCQRDEQSRYEAANCTIYLYIKYHQEKGGQTSKTLTIWQRRD